MFLDLKSIFILIVLSIFSSLIYLEILELDFWNLNKNIRNNISKRGEDEVILNVNETFYCFVKIKKSLINFFIFLLKFKFYRDKVYTIIENIL